MKIKCTFKEREELREFVSNEVVVGRLNPYCTPDLDFSQDITVSRTHARIWTENGAFWVEDLNSKHGTFVNEVRLTYQRQLNANDVIRVGETLLKIEIPTPVPARAVNPAEAKAETEIKVETALNAEETTLLAVAAATGSTQERLALLLELPLQFAARRNLEDLLQFIVERVVQVIPGAERGAILLRNQDNEELVLKAYISPDGPPVSQTLAQRAAREGRALVWRRVVDGVSSQSMRRIEMKTGMYAPLLWRDKSIGVLCVDNPKRDSRFSEEDLRLLFAVANYAAIAVAMQRLQEG